jgi:hypothetical protein
MKARLAPVVVVALVLLGGTAVRAQADSPDSTLTPILVLAQSVDVIDPAGVPPGMTVVFVPPAPDGFSDGGDGPGGLEWVMPDGFADGGDTPVPDGFIAAIGQPAGDDFWINGVVPDGLVAVYAWPAPDGFADGGDVPVGFVPVLFAAANEDSEGDSGGLGG